MFVTGLVLAAGGSSRLGRPKQLLPFGSGTLLGHVLDVARACPFDQTLCVVGGGGGRSGLDAVGFEGVDVIENPVFGEGCSSSIAAALGAVSPECSVLVLMLGDQPGVTSSAVTALLAGRGRRGAGGLSLRRRTGASVRVWAAGVRGSGDASRRQRGLEAARPGGVFRRRGARAGVRAARRRHVGGLRAGAGGVGRGVGGPGPGSR